MPKAMACLRAERLDDYSIAAFSRLTFSGVLINLGLPIVLGIAVESVFSNVWAQCLIELLEGTFTPTGMLKCRRNAFCLVITERPFSKKICKAKPQCSPVQTMTTTDVQVKVDTSTNTMNPSTVSSHHHKPSFGHSKPIHILYPNLYKYFKKYWNTI